MQHNYVDMEHSLSIMLTYLFLACWHHYMLHVDGKKSHVNMIMMYVDIIHPAYRGAELASSKIKLFS